MSSDTRPDVERWIATWPDWERNAAAAILNRELSPAAKVRDPSSAVADAFERTEVDDD